MTYNNKEKSVKLTAISAEIIQPGAEPAWEEKDVDKKRRRGKA